MVAKIDYNTTAAVHNVAAPPQLNCPRCDSTNTKFCYYNNYSLTQPRHFCKSCKRYWTRGGTLRNVPVGGGCRKNKRAKKTAAPSLPPAPPAPIHTPASDLSSLLYGLPPLMNSKTVFFPPKLELAGYEENFQYASNIADLQNPAASAPVDFLEDYSLLNSQIASSSSPADSYQPLLLYDDLNMVTHENNAPNHRSIHPIEAMNGSFGEVAEPSYLYWNQAVSGSWAESGSSLAPLI